MDGEMSTLDEPISTTLWRDLKAIGLKLRHVLFPGSDHIKVLRDWDLWGPLFLCLTLASILSASAPDDDQAVLVFSTIFVIVWFGAAVVTINALLLGGKLSFFQSVCVIGYCIFPLTIASVLCLVWRAFLWRLIVVIVAFIWSTYGKPIEAHETMKQFRDFSVCFPFFFASLL
eukprot:TRINITY_DN348_c0_g2_i1.p1 TRINITY_DN348_c0_g2~~TRINITY_DN348_c0_g2_i1.p1  ORF type:complete len:173 (+),score=28.56 TRINITY_DN348_c0_g2_i1:61-579(+)